VTDYPTIKRLFERRVEPGKVTATEVKESMEALTKHLGRGRDLGRLRLRLLGGRKRNTYAIELLGGEGRMSQSEADEFDFEVVCTEETWAEIANGDLSPIDAYLAGRMELTGDLDFAKRQLAKVTSRTAVEELPL
jgi:hypothetical protein